MSFNGKTNFPACDTLSQFVISDINIMNFKRCLRSTHDCVINALQIFGILDVRSANIMRISIGNSNIGKEQIEKIFVLTCGNNFEFKSTIYFDEFILNVYNLLKPGNGVFAGYNGHVFILARLTTGDVIIIDPSLHLMCDVRLMSEYLENCPKPYFLLFNSNTRLSTEQLSHMGFLL